MKKFLLASAVLSMILAVFAASPPTQAAAPFPADINGVVLRDGDVISANISAGDPDIFIVKTKSFYGAPDPGAIPDSYNGFKRLFLNPAIFNMYGHLGGFARVRQVTAAVRDSFVTSGLFRNCETGDLRVWATEVTGEDNGILHHVQMTGDQAAAEDPRFFDRVFCINTREDNFYAKSVNPYYRLADIPIYFRRTCQIRPSCLDSEPRCQLPEPIEGWCLITPTPTPPPGCYYQEVQCNTAPCNPQLVCSSSPNDPSYPMNVESATFGGIRNDATGTDDVFVRITGSFPNTCYYTDIHRSFPYPPKVTAASGDENWRLDVTVLGFLGRTTACPQGNPQYTTDFFNLSPSMEQGRVYNLYANGVFVGSATPFDNVPGAREASQERNTQRWSNVNTILNAIRQRMADNQGVWNTTCGSTFVYLPSDTRSIGTVDIDLAACIVPTYVSVMVKDPSGSSYEITQYAIRLGSDGKITVSAPQAELGEVISVTR